MNGLTPALANETLADEAVAESTGENRKSLRLWNPRHLGIGGRRAGDAVNTYVDRYEPSLLIVTMVTIVCCFLDAAFTLKLLSVGATELNLFMATLIEADIRTFVQLKIALTSLSLILLVIHKNFTVGGVLRVSHVLYFFCAGYLSLVAYELYLFTLV
ncbi:MAG: DUF5658 family protein [Pseudomonadota bacterium]